jgi:iron complex outermembrane receptor protein
MSGRSFLWRTLPAAGLIAGIPLVASGAVLEEIVVTAQKREQTLQDVSASVTAIGMDRLQASNIDNLEDLSLVVPSIYLGNDFNMAKLFIRGVGANTSTTGSETGVALHVDGAFVARAEAQLTSLFDLERVEVLRGPQGSLYGRNAVGGSINLITAKPTEELTGYGRLIAGNFNALGFEGALGGPIWNDMVLGRVAINTESRDGFGRNPVTGSDVDDLERRMARAHLEFRPVDTLDVLLTGEYYTQDDRSRALKFRSEAFPGIPRLVAGGCVTGTCTFAEDPRDVASEIDPETETDTWSVTGTVTWQPTEDLTLVSITNYRSLEGFITQDLDIAATLNSLATTGFNTTVQRRDVDSRQWSEEIQLRFDNRDWLNGVAGLFYFDERQRPVDTVGLNAVLGQPEILNTLATLPVFPPIGPTGLQVDGVFVEADSFPQSVALALCDSDEFIDVTPTTPPKRVCIKSDLGTEVWALFGQANLIFGKFTLKLGGRYSEEKRTASNPSVVVARNGLGPVITTTADGSFNEETFKDFTPEIGFEWRATDDLMFYYTYSEGFKAGAGENAAPNPESAPLSAIVDPEEIRNHEVGIKSAWFDNRLAVNVAAYSYDLEGQQINKTVSGGPAGFTTIFENAAEASAEGIELEFFAIPTDAFRVSGAVSYLHSRYDEFLTTDPLNPRNIATPGPPGFPADPTGFNPAEPQVQLAGNPTRNSPDWTASLHAEYDFPDAAIPGDGVLTLMGDVRYSDDVVFTEFARMLEGEDAYTLLDLNLWYSSGDGHWTANLWAKNITDERVASSTFQLATARTIGVTYLPPRTYGVTLGYGF